MGCFVSRTVPPDCCFDTYKFIPGFLGRHRNGFFHSQLLLSENKVEAGKLLALTPSMTQHKKDKLGLCLGTATILLTPIYLG